MNDPYLRAERQPPAIVALGVRLKAHYGVGPDAFGIKGNEYHYSGFHRSRNFLLQSTLGNGGDYSTRGAKNQGGNGNNNCAWDLTPSVWGTDRNRQLMIEATKRLRTAARAHDPRLDAYYEFAGTEDGKHVVTFYAQGGEAKDPFDSSHLDHLHGSKWRSMADNDDTGVGDIILGIGGTEEDDMGASTPPIEIERSGITSLTIPPVLAGTADPRPAWLNLCNATGDQPYALRVFYSLGAPDEWHAIEDGDWEGGLRVLRGGQRESVSLPQFTSGLDIRRWGVGPDGKPMDPANINAKVYPGHLTCAIERGAVQR
jgi:hypothetical protein